MLKKRYKKSESIISRKIEEEFILVPIRQDAGDLSSIYTLNDVAARIWELIDGKVTAEAIRDKIADEYEVTAEEAGADIVHYLKQLEAGGFISSD